MWQQFVEGLFNIRQAPVHKTRWMKKFFPQFDVEELDMSEQSPHSNLI